MDDKQYIKGFNQGYLLKSNKAELYDTLAKGIEGDTPYKEGFVDGGQQYEFERTKERLKERMTKDKTKNREQ